MAKITVSKEVHYDFFRHKDFNDYPDFRPFRSVQTRERPDLILDIYKWLYIS